MAISQLEESRLPQFPYIRPGMNLLQRTAKSPPVPLSNYFQFWPKPANMSHHQRRNHHSRRPPTKTKSSSSSRRLSHADEKPYNPHLYDTHLFCLRLFSLTPLEGSWGRISAGTIPQWTWDVRQCREWVADVLIKREKLSKKDAKSIAERLDCSGAGIYDLEEHEWEEMLYPREKSEEEEKVDDSDDVDDAVEWDGMGKRICAMLARRRSGKGAVPERRRNLRG